MIDVAFRPSPTVIVIDDDASVREALEGLFRSVGLGVVLFRSVQDFLAGDAQDCPGCMVLDVRLPGQSGLDFFDELTRTGKSRSVVFISGHADVAMSVRAMKAGAVEFLTKPVKDQELLDAVQMAIERDRTDREGAEDMARVRRCFDTLTPRERDILALVVAGRRNKQIAVDLGVTEATVKMHRGHVMQKMRAQSIAELVRLTDMLYARQSRN